MPPDFLHGFGILGHAGWVLWTLQVRVLFGRGLIVAPFEVAVGMSSVVRVLLCVCARPDHGLPLTEEPPCVDSSLHNLTPKESGSVVRARCDEIGVKGAYALIWACMILILGVRPPELTPWQKLGRTPTTNMELDPALRLLDPPGQSQDLSPRIPRP